MPFKIFGEIMREIFIYFLQKIKSNREIDQIAIIL